jgi:C-terminal processing protease CtpA/Prc
LVESQSSTVRGYGKPFVRLEAGKIVGEETGGLASSYGDVFSCRLPNSGLRLGISYKYFLRPGGFDDGRGVIPDIPIDSNPVKRVKGKDVVLENLLKTIEKNHEVTQ